MRSNLRHLCHNIYSILGRIHHSFIRWSLTVFFIHNRLLLQLPSSFVVCCCSFQQNCWATPKTGLNQCGFTHCCLELDTCNGTVCLSFDQSLLAFWINRYEMAIRLIHSWARYCLFPETICFKGSSNLFRPNWPTSVCFLTRDLENLKMTHQSLVQCWLIVPLHGLPQQVFVVDPYYAPCKLWLSRLLQGSVL